MRTWIQWLWIQWLWLYNETLDTMTLTFNVPCFWSQIMIFTVQFLRKSGQEWFEMNLSRTWFDSGKISTWAMSQVTDYSNFFSFELYHSTSSTVDIVCFHAYLWHCRNEKEILHRLPSWMLLLEDQHHQLAFTSQQRLKPKPKSIDSRSDQKTKAVVRVSLK